jgi:branched-chain amino acid transport system ATP-binding protein
MLAIDRLSKRFGALTVTDGVTLQVRPGELHALIGPNGAGKTTLINQITGLIAPDAGRIRLAGADITLTLAHERVRMGLVRSFQITSLLARLTALENVALAAQARDGSSFRFLSPVAGDRRLNDRAAAALALVGLDGRRDVPAGRLSHGERRLLELAVCFVLEPRMLVLDEPMAGTGLEEGRGLVDRLQRLKGGCAMLLVEHDMEAVFRLADRISVLVYGRLVATGTPEEIRRNEEVRLAYLGDEAPVP